MAEPLIAVTGVTGYVGRAAAERLAATGADLRLVVRDAATAPQIPGAAVATAPDYGATEQMTEALRGADTLLLISARESQDRLQQHYSAIDAAVAAGVSRIVYTSFVGAAPDAVFTLAREHHATEEAIRQSGLAWVFQRQNLYADLMPLWADVDGVIRGPAGSGSFTPVVRSDVAEVAAALLLDEQHDGEVLNVCGPERMTFDHLTARLTALTPKFFEYERESVEDAYASRAGLGAAQWQLDAWVSTYVAVAEGELDVTSDTVERLTGHPATTFERFIAATPACWEHVKRDAP